MSERRHFATEPAVALEPEQVPPPPNGGARPQSIRRGRNAIITMCGFDDRVGAGIHYGRQKIEAPGPLPGQDRQHPGARGNGRYRDILQRET